MRDTGVSPWLVVIGLALLLHGYLGWRLLSPLPLWAQGLGWGLMLVSVILQPLAIMPTRPAGLPHTLQVAGWLCMGLMSFLLVFTLLRDVMLLTASLWGGNTLDLQLGSALGVVALAVGATMWGWVQAIRTPAVRTVQVSLAQLSTALEGFTIVQLSDVHVGSTIRQDFLRPVVERVNALNADLVVLTGDVVDGSVPRLRPHTALLAQLQSRYGTYVVNGNHEYYSGEAQWADEYRHLGLQLLKNQHEVIWHQGSPLVVAGVTDFSAARFNRSEASDPRLALAGAPAEALKILLAHQPRSAAAAEQAGADLQLSGHTHGGQYWPWMYFVPLQQPYVAGLYQQGRLQVYVSRGTGFWGPPVRLGSVSEITRLVLTRHVDENI